MNIEKFPYPYMCASDDRCHEPCGLGKNAGSMESPECQNCIWNECGPSQVSSDNVCGYFNCSKKDCPRCAIYQECDHCGDQEPDPYYPPYEPPYYPPYDPNRCGDCTSGDYNSRVYCCERTLTPYGCPLCAKGCVQTWNGMCEPSREVEPPSPPPKPLECGKCVGCMTPNLGCVSITNKDDFDCKDPNFGDPSWLTCKPKAPKLSKYDKLYKKFQKCDKERAELRNQLIWQY